MSLTRRERERLKAEGYLEPDPTIAAEGDVGPRALAALLGALVGFLVGVPVAPGLGFVLVVLGGAAGWFAAGALGEAVESAVDAVWTVDPDAEEPEAKDDEPEAKDAEPEAKDAEPEAKLVDEAKPADEAKPDDEATPDHEAKDDGAKPDDEATPDDEAKPQA